MATAGKDPERSSLAGPITASVGIHLLILGFLPAPEPGNRVTSLSAPVREKVVRVRLHPLPPDRPIEPSARVVDVIDPNPAERSAPSDARFLAEKNRSVPKETQARMTGLPSTGSSVAKPRLEVPGEFLREDPPAIRGGIAMVSPSNYLPEIAFGDETLLNTREYAYATYYIRMKRQMEAVWNPGVVLENERLGRPQYVTTVRITLEKNGYLREAKIIKPSGNDRLDRIAVESVASAAPYLNPPTPLVGEDGVIRIPIWNFIVTLRARD